MSNNCPICNTNSKIQPHGNGLNYVDCPNCKEFINACTQVPINTLIKNCCHSNGVAEIILSSLLRHKSAQKYINSKKIPNQKATPLVIDAELITSLAESLKKGIIQLPTPAEQINNFIIYLGQNLNSISDTKKSDFFINLDGIVGAPISQNTRLIGFIVNNLDKEGLLYSNNESAKVQINKPMGLSLKGWNLFHELQKNRTDSKRAFMAMKFKGDTQNIVFPVLQEEVKKAGYELFYVSDDKEVKAGNITDSIAVGIRNSRFLVADLSDGNQGAYWEAGFAYGLGKPVFYICDEEIFNDKDRKSQCVHFDVNQHTTILWNKNNPLEAAKKLKSAIRNTLFTEAIVEDK